MPPLRVLRWQRGLSQKELAQRSGLSERSIWSVERGASVPHPRNQRAIAKALGCQIVEVDEFDGDSRVEQGPQHR